VAAGLQNMSRIPISSAMLVAEQFGDTDPFSGSTGWVERYGDQEVSQFRGADMIAEKWEISREDMEEFAMESHRRAITARAEGRFDNEIVELAGLTFDEGPREPDPVKIASLKTLREGGRITAAVASQISDASAAMLDRLGAGGEGPRSDAPGPHPPPVGARRRSRSTCSRRRSRPPSTRSRRRA
jgi:acetyl-CoA C-acetyltransferase